MTDTEKGTNMDDRFKDFDLYENRGIPPLVLVITLLAGLASWVGLAALVWYFVF